MVKSRVKTLDSLARVKRKIAKRYKVPCPSNIELLKAYHKLARNKSIEKSEKIENLLRTRPIRSLSGIINVSVLTKPYPCPGKCIYCPNEKGIPKSYVSGEPAVERAKKLKYDPYLQTKKRLETLALEGHPTDKVELRMVGGTFSFYPKKYQSWFITRCFAACNAKLREIHPHTKIWCRGKRKTTPKIKSLKDEQKLNEKAKHRIVGLSVETRPDFITPEEIKWLRSLGVTMVELGVQSIYDDVLKLNRRGHGVDATVKATKLLKDAGFKVLYQVMPNLPGSNLKKDEKMFKEIFKNPDFQPDFLKIYPTAILKGTLLYKWWKEKKYKPYADVQLINLIKSIKKKIPYYVRIQRITRDIPSQSIVSGPAKISNLRQIIARDMKKEGWQCRCIRCREVKENYPPLPKVSKDKLIQKLKLFRQDYPASDGKEVFLNFEDKNRQRLYSLLRLRLPSQCYKNCSHNIIPILENAAIIREIHTYGQQLPLRREAIPEVSPQHKGLGQKLIKEAEKITKREFNLKKIAVISGVGARDYFRKMGYKLKDEYMIKEL